MPEAIDEAIKRFLYKNPKALLTYDFEYGWWEINSCCDSVMMTLENLEKLEL